MFSWRAYLKYAFIHDISCLVFGVEFMIIGCGLLSMNSVIPLVFSYHLSVENERNDMASKLIT